ncbi:hypothetical protein ED733_007292 [Metarhizium rileyi]|uniref:C2H2-type domain-containing protein n=1 Tax=Metarhizium rileyi (strain RCEF 4871) TaxID=1649241 RepID=A0A5C6GFK0_METRR|nr:hypothetical protein ED733_007292 [Metarhizium rileyi]
MDDQSTPGGGVLPQKETPVWTKFGERLTDRDTPKSVFSRQVSIKQYADPAITHDATGSRIAARFPASPSPGETSTAHKQGPENGFSLPKLLTLPKRVRTETGLLPQSPGQDTAPSSATPPPSSTVTPTSHNRGRPRGWRPGMSYAAMRGNTPPAWKTARSPRQPRAKAPQPGSLRKPGRQPRARSPPPKELYYKANSRFIKFLCEWEGCKAELHNFDTLRRHLQVVHQKRGKWSCHWGHCDLNACADAREWQSHLEDAHLVPFRWHVGDGPNNSSGTGGAVPHSTEAAIPDFLMDADGQQVTPSVKDQKLEDFATWRENRRKLKELLVQRDQNLPDESTESSEDSSDDGR